MEEDSYGILPQSFITHVGEHMLALVQALEPFASDSEALGLANEDGDVESKASTAFCNQWLDVVGLAVTGRILERTMRIPRLGRKGAEHLAADLNYIRNVFTALGVAGHPHPLLKYAAQLVILDEDSLRSRIASRCVETDSSETLDVIRRAELRIAYVRSISV
ncbi:predicted protein [Thalassiosira pseudonana CCMP1335]|uniref:Conserved oligomeric Golgi complex subunit 7 n=1 Tax=Thalassiosira pseudonana TaxID=35128 RepID=B8CCS0_THAPS|nr:predicted protein [Thalassiosira pseudonana CCMP1335]EED88825.1 predicted protein [Thalassiosira pseudonana CCMP1335]